MRTTTSSAVRSWLCTIAATSLGLSLVQVANAPAASASVIGTGSCAQTITQDGGGVVDESYVTVATSGDNCVLTFTGAYSTGHYYTWTAPSANVSLIAVGGRGANGGNSGGAGGSAAYVDGTVRFTGTVTIWPGGAGSNSSGGFNGGANGGGTGGYGGGGGGRSTISGTNIFGAGVTVNAGGGGGGGARGLGTGGSGGDGGPTGTAGGNSSQAYGGGGATAAAVGAGGAGAVAQPGTDGSAGTGSTGGYGGSKSGGYGGGGGGGGVYGGGGGGAVYDAASAGAGGGGGSSSASGITSPGIGTSGRADGPGLVEFTFPARANIPTDTPVPTAGVTGTTMSVAFNYTAGPPSAITYDAWCQSQTDSLNYHTGGTTSPIVVTGLPAGKSYRCSYSAYATGGWSSGGSNSGYSPWSTYVLLPGPPVNTVAPALSATPSSPSLLPTKTAVGQALSATDGTWTLPAGASYVGTPTYQWDSSSDGSTWAAIAGATTNALSPGSDLVGKYVRVGVTRVDTFDAGVHTFGATAYSTATPVVIDVPAVAALSLPSAAASTPGQVLVEFTVPNQNSSNISKFQYKLDSGSWTDVSGANISPTGPAWTTGTTETLTVPSLTNGTAYVLTVRSVNEAGTSAVSNSLTVTPLGAPTLTSVLKGDGQATVNWTAPVGGGQTSYRVQESHGGSAYADAAGCGSLTAGSTSCLATGLSNEISYSFKVAGVNATGTGQYSVSTPVTPYSQVSTLSAMAVRSKLTSAGAPSAVTPRPAFAAGTATYTATVSANVAFATITPTYAYTGTQGQTGEVVYVTTGDIGVSGAPPVGTPIVPTATASADIPLATGANLINVLVWSRDRDVDASSTYWRTYTVTITRTAPVFTPIIAYTTDQSDPPTPGDYVIAGVSGVTASNVNAINSVVARKTASQVDSTAEIQALVDAYGTILAYADNGASPAPTAADYQAISVAGASGLGVDSLALINSVVDAGSVSDVNTVSKLDVLLAGSTGVIATAAMAPPGSASTLTVAQLTAMGITGVTSGNLANIIGAISGNAAASVDSVSEVQALVTGANTAAVSRIATFTGTPPLTPQDYADAGTTGVTDGNVASINAAITGLPSSSRDSTAEIQSVIDAYLHILDRTVEGTSTVPVTAAEFAAVGATTAAGLTPSPQAVTLLDSVLTISPVSAVATPTLIDALATTTAMVFANPNVMTIDDFTTVGIVGVTAGNVAALQSLVQGTAAAAKDSVAELQALVDRANSLAIISDYGNGVGAAPSIFDYLGAGVVRVTSANLAAVNAEIVSTASAYNFTHGPASWVASAAGVQTIVDGIMATSIVVIAAYDGLNTVPTAATYSAAGVLNVSADNLVAVNSAIAGLPVAAGSRDSRARIQAVVDAYNALLAIASGSPNSPSVTAATFTTLGITGVTAANLDGVLAAIAAAGPEGIVPISALQAVTTAAVTSAATGLAAILAYAADGTPDVALSDFSAAGLAGATASNLAAVKTAILEAAPVPTSQAELQVIIDSVTAPSVEVIAGYPGNGGDPTSRTWENAGIPGMPSSQVDELNNIVKRLPSTAKDTREELQDIADAFLIITSNAKGLGNNDSPYAIPTVTDYETIGVNLGALAGNPEGMALLNSVIRGLPYETVASVDQLNRIVSILIRLMRIVAGSQAQPALTAADFATIGVTGVNDGNVARLIANLAASGANGTFIPTLAFVQSLVPPGSGGGSGGGVPSLDPVTPEKIIVPGSVSALVDGRPVGVIIAPLPDDRGLDATGPGFAVTWTMLDVAGSPMRIDPGNVLVGERGGSLRLTGTGYAGTSPVHVYLLGSAQSRVRHDSELLGSVTTTADGTFDITVLLPMDADLGPASIQVVGLTDAGSVRALTVGAQIRGVNEQVSRTIVYFAPDSAVLTSAAKARLSAAVTALPADAQHVTMFVVSINDGGRDTQTRPARALAKARAHAVAAWLRTALPDGRVVSATTGVAAGRPRVTTTCAYALAQ